MKSVMKSFVNHFFNFSFLVTSLSIFINNSSASEAIPEVINKKCHVYLVTNNWLDRLPGKSEDSTAEDLVFLREIIKQARNGFVGSQKLSKIALIVLNQQYLSKSPKNTEEIAQTFGISHSVISRETKKLLNVFSSALKWARITGKVPFYQDLKKIKKEQDLKLLNDLLKNLQEKRFGNNSLTDVEFILFVTDRLNIGSFMDIFKRDFRLKSSGISFARKNLHALFRKAFDTTLHQKEYLFKNNKERFKVLIPLLFSTVDQLTGQQGVRHLEYLLYGRSSDADRMRILFPLIVTIKPAE